VFSTQANSTLFFGLWYDTAAIDETFTALSTGESTGSTYARIGIANSSANFTNASGGQKKLKTAFNFTESAGSDWGTIGKLVILDSSSTTTGNVLTWTTFAAQTISAGNTVTVTTDLTFSAS
jgi:hypothetical protein